MPVQKLRVLVIDDEPQVADSLAKILDLFGYQATSVYSPTQAIELINTQPCDILIADVVMEGHPSGIDLAIQFASLLPECKVLLISGNNSTVELLRAAQEHGYTFEVLAKPVHPNVILQRLKTMMD